MTTPEAQELKVNLLTDCRIMLQFGLKEARIFPDALLHDIAILDRGLKKKSLPIVSAIPDVLVSDEAVDPAGAAVDLEELLLKVHAGLSKVVAPATALTLETSEPAPSRWRMFGGTPWIVKAAIPTALICAFIFVGTTAMIGQTGTSPAEAAEAAGKAAAAEKAENDAKQSSAKAVEAATAARTALPPLEKAAQDSENAAKAAPAEADLQKQAEKSRKAADDAKEALAKADAQAVAEQKRVAETEEAAKKAKEKSAQLQKAAEETAKSGVVSPGKSKIRLSLENSIGLTVDGLAILNAFAGAALGAAFYILIKTHPFLLSRSFDPKFDAAYTSRFIIGVVAGVLLATVMKKFVETGSALDLTAGMLAILGGYAAEFVEQVLQRMVETLQAAIRGDGSAQAAADAAQKNVEVRNKLVDLEKLKNDPAAYSKALEELHALLKQRGQ